MAADAAPAGNKVLILAGTVSGGKASIEATEAAAQGLSADVVDAATWTSMTAAQFHSYRAIVLGDPNCQGITSDVQAAAANARTWGSVVNGNIVIIGSDPVLHSSQGGKTVTQRGIDFAVAQSGKTGAYITLSCYYHGTAAKTPVPLLDGIGGGGFTTTGVGCYNDAHIVAESPALAGLTDKDISNWSCSVHEAFQSWPGSLIPLAIARAFDSSFTASDGTQGPPYILAGGDIKSFPLSLDPLSGNGPAGGPHGITAQLLDGVTRAAVSGARIGFNVISGPNAGARGSCSPVDCVTAYNGHATFTYRSNGTPGDDVIEAFYDRNGNGTADIGEPRTTAGMTWTKPSHIDGTYGPGWPFGGRDFTLYYSYGGTHMYLGNVYQGAVNWTSSGTEVHIQQWPGVPFAVHISIADTDKLPKDYAGLTWFGEPSGPDCQSCVYTHNYILLNTNLRQIKPPFSDFDLTKTATHELGHALGLEHPQDAGYTDKSKLKSIMWQGPGLGYNSPQPYDIGLLNELYR